MSDPVLTSSWCTNWGAYNTPRLWSMVMDEDENAGRDQVSAWRTLAGSVRSQRQALLTARADLVAAWPPEENASSAAFVNELDILIGKLDAASADADSTGSGLDNIVTAIQTAKTTIKPLWEKYKDKSDDWVPNWWDHAEDDIDKEARNAMITAERAVEDSVAQLKVPEPYSLKIDGGSIDEEPGSGEKPTGGGGRTGGSTSRGITAEVPHNPPPHLPGHDATLPDGNQGGSVDGPGDLGGGSGGGGGIGGGGAGGVGSIGGGGSVSGGSGPDLAGVITPGQPPSPGGPGGTLPTTGIGGGGGTLPAPGIGGGGGGGGYVPGLLPSGGGAPIPAGGGRAGGIRPGGRLGGTIGEPGAAGGRGGGIPMGAGGGGVGGRGGGVGGRGVGGGRGGRLGGGIGEPGGGRGVRGGVGAAGEGVGGRGGAGGRGAKPARPPWLPDDEVGPNRNNPGMTGMPGRGGRRAGGSEDEYDFDPDNPWEVAEGVDPVIAPSSDNPRHDPGPNVIGWR
ncbi:hypothetical protein ACQP2F_42095 [Actinoplanes sp. CA-030573]|uniref:hypothetical protein n=1 Tax=Actinoplanes sp. CA-030573 TaxID=3239898 RepID=UPI003D8B29A9